MPLTWKRHLVVHTKEWTVMAAQPRIQFIIRPDGTRLADTVRGEGLPQVRPPGWLSHQGVYVENTLEVEFADALAAATPRWMQVHYDKQGTGLSDRHRTDFTLDSSVSELESVVDHMRLARFALFCGSGAGCVGVAYAARHPERVSRLIFASAFARGASAMTLQLEDAVPRDGHSHTWRDTTWHVVVNRHRLADRR